MQFSQRQKCICLYFITLFILLHNVRYYIIYTIILLNYLSFLQKYVCKLAKL